MSGIVAAAQSAGCCCRPQEGCPCSDPNRPGAIADSQITSVAVSCEMTLDDAERNNGCYTFGCSCNCSAEPLYGFPNGPFYGYQRQGAIVDPDFSEGTECEPLICRAGCCGGCPIYSCGSEFGTVIAERTPAAIGGWVSRISVPIDNICGTWSWRPRQVGYCVSSDGYRVRKYCPFSNGFDLGGPIDPNGQYVTSSGEYTGRNSGLLNAYAITEVGGFYVGGGGDCSYTVRIGIFYGFTSLLEDYLATYGTFEGFGRPGIPSPAEIEVQAVYVKPCTNPSDTVLGQYRLLYEPQYDYADEDSECGRIRYFKERRASFPQFLTVS